MKNVAFENTDGSLVWIIFNDSKEEQVIELAEAGQTLGKVCLPAKAAGTFVKGV